MGNGVDYSLENQNKQQSYRRQLSQYWKPWRKAISVQRQTLSALIFRETKTRFGEQSLGILWAFGEVLSHIFIFWGLWTVMGRQAHNGLATPMFLISGMVPYFMFSNIFSKSADCISANRALLVFSQIHIFDFVLSRAIVELTIYMSAITIFLVGLYFFEFDIQIYSLVRVIWGILVLWILGIGLGLIYLPFKGKFKIIDTIVSVGFRMLYFISGAIFPLEAAPKWAIDYLQYNPVLHLIEYIRTGFIDNYGIFNNIEYGFVCALFTLMIGLILLKRLKKMILQND
ncbi:MAG: capsular polysaccharide transport system permease protein [Alphaproteobacteria bacterium]